MIDSLPFGAGRQMASNPADPHNAANGSTDRNTLVTNKFSVEVDKIHLAYFRKFSNLTITTAVDDFWEGGLNSHKHVLPLQTSISKAIKLEKGVVVNDLLWSWYYEEVCNGIYEPRTVKVHAHENVQSPTAWGPILVTWVLDTALPIAWEGLEFDASSDKVDRLINSLTFVCAGWATKQDGLNVTAAPVSRTPVPKESPGLLGDS